MYNGIGLATVRGSGTNGYVQKNLSFVSQTRAAERKERVEGVKRDIPQPRQPDKDIIEHNRKRDIEVKVIRLREALEDKGVDEAEIEAKTSEMRKNLLAQLPAPKVRASKGAQEAADPRGAQETHAMAAAKQAETTALKNALGISTDYVAGQAFDRELQARRREERQAQRAAEEAKVAELEALLEKEKRREQKQQEKDRKRAEKEEKKRKKREAKGKPPKEPREGGSSSAPPPPEREEREPLRRDERGDSPERRGEKRSRSADSDSASRSPAPRRSRRDSPSRSRSRSNRRR